MTRCSTMIALLWVAGFALRPLIAAAERSPTTPPPGHPIVLRPGALVHGGAVLTARASATECARHDVPAPGDGGAVLGIAACDAAVASGGWVQLERVLAPPYPSTVLTLRVAPPAGIEHPIRGVRRGARVRIVLDGRPLWETRVMENDVTGRYRSAIASDVATTIVIKQRETHVLRFEAEPGAIWAMGYIEITARPSPAGLRGIAYSPYRDCQAPGGTRLPGGDEIDDDMFRIAHTANAIRTYSTTGANARIAEAAAAQQRALYAGAWLDEIDADAAELHGLLELTRTAHPAGLIVGNEFYLRHRAEGRAAANYLLDRIRAIKSALPAQHPLVMTAEVDGIMFRWACRNGALAVEGIAPEYRPILDATDAVLVHIYPFWEGQPIAGAAALATARYVAIRDYVSRQYPGKRVILGETGWPSTGAPMGGAVPGPDAQRRYMAEFMQLADAHAIDYFYFDAFDEGWKVAEPGHVGQHWGYADATRAVKYDISGMLLPGALLASKVTPPASDLGAVCGRVSGAATAAQASTAASESSRDRTCKAGPIYSDWLNDDARFVPVGWIGDTRKIDLFECDRSAPHGGEMAIRAAFNPDGPRGWAGVVWQDPASEWGRRAGGCDLRGVNQVSFWVRGARGGEVVEFQVGGVGAANAASPDTIRPARSSGPVVLTASWQPVTIGLAGADRRRVIGAFSWIASRCNNAQPISFFLDDIRLDAAPLSGETQVLAHRPFYVYDDADSGCEHYVPSGFMGDTSDLSLDPRSTEMPYQGRTALRVSYRRSARPAQRWAGVYWQAPENNWGTVDGGFDLSWARTLTFHARGRRGGETVEFFAAGLGTVNDRYHDSAPKRTTGRVHLSTSWQRYAIDLRGVDLSRIAGGFGFAVALSNNPEGAEFFLDEIAYER